jgi:hypothetical protein
MNIELVSLNNTINKYNIELKKYTNNIWYYRKIIIFGFILLMIIVIIFNIKSIDNYIKALILLFILLILIIYYKNNIIQEDFTVCLDKSNNIQENNYYDNRNYYIALDKYLYYIEYLSSYNVPDILQNNTIQNLLNKITIIKQNKKELYKLKTMSLESSIDLFNKNINSYYYHTVCVLFNIFIIFISIILYLLLPNIIIFIIILIVISIFISIYYTQYNIHRTTRIDEKKYYWAYLNPSKIILDLL